MHTAIAELEQAQIRSDIPEFRPGDTLRVHVKVTEGTRSRIQVFQGVVLRRQGGGARETFTVRKISYGVGVERTFPVHSPSIDKIEVVTRGRVRRAKLYYLRSLRGKAARIEERRDLNAFISLTIESGDGPVVAVKDLVDVRGTITTAGAVLLPAEPADLTSHDCVMFNAKNNERDWDLVSGRRKVRVHVSGAAASRDINSARAFVHRGHGIGLLPATYCEEDIANGKLIRLLPKWTSLPIPVFALYSSRKFLPLRLSVFLEALAGWKGPLWVKD